MPSRTRATRSAQARSRVRPTSTRAPTGSPSTGQWRAHQASSSSVGAAPVASCPVAGSTSTTASRPGATTSATVHGTTSSHSCATTSTSSRSVSPGGSAAPPGERSQATASGRSCGRGTTSTPVSRRSGRRCARWASSSPRPHPTSTTWCTPSRSARRPIASANGAPSGPWVEVVKCPAGPWRAAVEPVRAVERVVPRLAPGDHHEPHAIPAPAVRWRPAGHPGARVTDEG